MTQAAGHVVKTLGGGSLGFADPDSAIRYAVSAIRMLILEGASHPTIYRLARRIVRECPEMDRACHVRALRAWVRGHVRYVPDPAGLDSLAAAEETIQIGAGDCDDVTTVFGALARSVALPVVLIMGTVRPGLTLPTHILPGVTMPGGVVPVELSTNLPIGALPRGFRVLETVTV